MPAWAQVATPMPATTAATQQPDELVTDRPDFTESAQTIAPGRFQLESGLTIQRTGAVRSSSYGEALVRVGLNDRTELRLGVPSYLRAHGAGAATSGLDDSFLGAKFRFTQKDAPTSVALLVGSTLPTGARRVATRKYQPEAVLSVEPPPIGNTAVGVNLGYVRASDGAQRFDQFFGSVALGFDIAPKTGAFLETFAFSKDSPGSDMQTFIDGGLSYLLTPDMQLDARLGFGVGNSAGGPDYFYGIGLSRRF